MTFLSHLHEVSDLISLALYITAAVYMLLGFYVLSQKTMGGISWYLGWMMLGMAWWSASYGMEVRFQPIAAKIFWVHMKVPAATFISVLWFFFSLGFVGESKLVTHRNLALASILPVFITLAEWTNEFHHLYFLGVRLDASGSLSLLAFNFGPLFYVGIAYSYLLLFIGSILLLVQTFHVNSLFRVQTVAMLCAVLPPWIASAVYIAGVFPIHNFDITPFAFVPTVFILTLAITRFKLLDVVPPAQHAILQELQDGVILLDARQRILYVNHAAEEMLSIDAARSLGQTADTVCNACAPAILPLLGRKETRSEVLLNEPRSRRWLEVRVTPYFFTASERQGEAPSYLLVFHDATRQKEAEEGIKYHEAILQAMELASELFLKSVAWEKNIPNVLQRLGEAAGVSRVYIFEREAAEDGGSRISQRYEWARAGVEPQIDNPDLQQFEWISAGFGRWDETLQKREVIFGAVRGFPESERAWLDQQGVLSLVVMPVFVEDEFWGFMGFDDCAIERAWSNAELEALRAAADIFGAALERGKIEKRLLGRERSQTLLREILRAALSMDKIDEMGKFLVHHLGSLIGADQCFLALWEETRGQIIPAAAYGVNEELYLGMKVHEGEVTLTASALAAGHTLIVEDAQDSPYVSQRIAALFATRSVLVVPMISGEKKLGAVLLGFNRRHCFTMDETMLCEQAADLVALALSKFQAVENARRRAEEADTLRRAGVVISETLNLQETTTRLLEQLAFVIPHDSASVQLLRDGELEIIGGEGWENPALVIGVRFPIPGDNPNTVVIQTRKPYLVNDTHETFPIFRTIEHASHIRSWLGVPLIVHNEIIGLLAIDSRETNRFTPDNIDLASAFAGQVAVAIENARLFEEVQRIAITDGLTGLYNRRHFLSLAENEFERALRYKRDLSVMLFDIDHFKRVNDEYGHPVGDQVLRALASLCADKLREADPVGRYGGEEFIALLVESPPAFAMTVGERLRREVENMTIPTEKGDIHVTISVGIAGVNELTPNLNTLINRADQALYVAKHKGRNRVVIGH